MPTFWNGKEAREDAQAKHFGSTHLTGQPTDARVPGGPGGAPSEQKLGSRRLQKIFHRVH